MNPAEPSLLCMDMVPARSSKIHYQDVMAVRLSAYESRAEGEQTVAEDPGSNLAMPEVGLREEALHCCAEGWEGHWFRDDVIHSGLSALLCVLR